MLNMDFIVFFWHLLNFFAPAAFLAVALGLGAWLCAYLGVCRCGRAWA